MLPFMLLFDLFFENQSSKLPTDGIIRFQNSGDIMASARIATALAVVLAAPSLIFDDVTASAIFPEEYKYNGEGRHLQTCSSSDDALDPTAVRITISLSPFLGLHLWLAPLLAQYNISQNTRIGSSNNNWNLLVSWHGGF